MAGKARYWTSLGFCGRQAPNRCGVNWLQRDLRLSRWISREFEKLILGQGSSFGNRFKLFWLERDFLNGAFRPSLEDAAQSDSRSDSKTTFPAGTITSCLGTGPWCTKEPTLP